MVPGKPDCERGSKPGGDQRAILSQQLNSVANSSATRDLAYSRRRAAESVKLAGSPLARRLRNVGFQPVITTLPEGANMTVTAIISADRRYVRITPIPLFSQIGKVTTFNLGTGEVMEQEPNEPAN